MDLYQELFNALDTLKLQPGESITLRELAVKAYPVGNEFQTDYPTFHGPVINLKHWEARLRWSGSPTVQAFQEAGYGILGEWVRGNIEWTFTKL